MAHVNDNKYLPIDNKKALLLKKGKINSNIYNLIDFEKTPNPFSESSSDSVSNIMSDFHKEFADQLDIVNNNLSVIGEGAKMGQEIKLTEQNNLHNSEVIELFDQNQFDLSLQVIKGKESNNKDLLLKVESLNEDNDYFGIKIGAGKRLKFGNVYFDLLMFVNSSSTKEDQLKYISPELNINNCIDIQNHEEVVQDNLSIEDKCKFCLENQSLDCLIKICQCRGSSGFYHLSCLQRWIVTKRIEFCLEKSKTLYWHNLKCESCLSDYPFFIKYRGRLRPLVNFGFPENSTSFILKSVQQDEKKYHSFHICHTKNIFDTFTIGRGENCNVRINDLTVSQLHALIRIDGDNLYLIDNNSKFGTYLSIKNFIKIIHEQEYNFVYDNNIFSLSLSSHHLDINQRIESNLMDIKTNEETHRNRRKPNSQSKRSSKKKKVAN